MTLFKKLISTHKVLDTMYDELKALSIEEMQDIRIDQTDLDKIYEAMEVLFDTMEGIRKDNKGTYYKTYRQQ